MRGTKAIAHRREFLDLTQHDVATAVSREVGHRVHPARAGRWERGACYPCPKHLVALAKVLGFREEVLESHLDQAMVDRRRRRNGNHGA